MRKIFLIAAVLPLYLVVYVCTASEKENQLKRHRQEGNLIYYSGTITVSGKYERRLDGMTLDIMGNEICFFPEKESAKLIPRENGDTRMPWFCFSNRDEASAQLDIPKTRKEHSCGFVGTATVVVSNYKVNLKRSSVFDTARLEKIIKTTTPRLMLCPKYPG